MNVVATVFGMSGDSDKYTYSTWRVYYLLANAFSFQTTDKYDFLKAYPVVWFYTGIAVIADKVQKNRQGTDVEKYIRENAPDSFPSLSPVSVQVYPTDPLLNLHDPRYLNPYNPMYIVPGGPGFNGHKIGDQYLTPGKPKKPLPSQIVTLPDYFSYPSAWPVNASQLEYATIIDNTVGIFANQWNETIRSASVEITKVNVNNVLYITAEIRNYLTNLKPIATIADYDKLQSDVDAYQSRLLAASTDLTKSLEDTMIAVASICETGYVSMTNAVLDDLETKYGEKTQDMYNVLATMYQKRLVSYINMQVTFLSSKVNNTLDEAKISIGTIVGAAATAIEPLIQIAIEKLLKANSDTASAIAGVLSAVGLVVLGLVIGF